ncbi:succinate dehydrogenase assembly factor 2 [Parasphingopyxis sp. CP4]|uniref:FAD assembly factor SdhE n=1 Tax=Parasphingopyxis sp. CP4 TaxID=2724527 RepID=UPI0015A4668B|nr:succinate dehydrogenase assembly factor 2 [Parasphingopyxis sp. CP4]QLC21562.1 succinate dehydrogenase assembly factor 2 [Parasphingopyxis sp. CP4]
MNHADRLKRLKFRAWHRGTKEADLLIGGFFDRFSDSWTNDQTDWFERLLEIDDVSIMAWAIGTEVPPENIDGPMMKRMQQLDYIPISE